MRGPSPVRAMLPYDTRMSARSVILVAGMEQGRADRRTSGRPDRYGTWGEGMPTRERSVAWFCRRPWVAVAFLFLLVSPLASAERPSALATSRRHWAATGPMAAARSGHTATLLPSGKVLVAGGSVALNTHGGTVTATADLYDPRTGVWTRTGAMTIARVYHTATLLLTGQVLVAGGCAKLPCDKATLGSAELYDPRTGKWARTGGMVDARSLHTATLLRDGTVLVVGGINAGGILARAELYSPRTNAWTRAGTLTTGRLFNTTTLLPNGLVLVAGGTTTKHGIIAGAELYNPSTGAWSRTGAMTASRYFHTATLLPNGTILVVGGADSTGTARGSAEIYDPTIGLWKRTGTMPTARYYHTAVLLPNATVLVCGGTADSDSATANLYDPRTGTWSRAGAMATAREGNTATLLPTGQVLIAGGTPDGRVVLTSAELYTP